MAVLCRVMRVSSSAFYAWCHRPKQPIDINEQVLQARMKALFNESRKSLGSRQLMKNLRKEGFKIGRYKTRNLMKKLALEVKRKKRFVLTTDSKYNEPVAENLLNRQFRPDGMNRVWTTDISYLWTRKGWVYLAVVIDLYSRRVVGWHVDDTMKNSLIARALMMAVNLRKPPQGLLHHSDRGSQYASKEYQQLLKSYSFICSMSRKGNCWDNSPTERFFSSLKREWTTGVDYLDKETAMRDVKKYISYYNGTRLHTTINDMTPIQFEKCA